MEQTKKVSIVVPVHNAEKYIGECINSILMQDYTNFELILVDDGSIDESLKLCNLYMHQDDRIKVIHQENSGVADARNTGIEASLGQYIVFLDADDWWECNYLSLMVKEKAKSDLVICGLVRCLTNGKMMTEPVFDCDMSQWCWPIIYNYSIPCWRCMFDLSIIQDKNIRFTSGRKTGEDQEFTYRYMLQTETIIFAHEALYYYRINPSSTMFIANYNHFQAVEAMKAVDDYAKKVCNIDRARKISKILYNYKYPYLLEFAILTVITSGENPFSVLQYLKLNGYFKILNDSCRACEHYSSKFMKIWKISPEICLYYYYWRRRFGSFLKSTYHKNKGKSK